MGNNSSGSAFRSSRDNLNEVEDEAKGSRRKKSVDDPKGSSSSSRSAAAKQPPDNYDDETAYDLPYEQPSEDAVSPKGDVAASSSVGPRKGSVPAAVPMAGAAALAASAAAAAAKAAGQRRGSDTDQSGRGSGEPASVEHRRNFFKKSKKSGDSGTKSHERSTSQSDSTVDDRTGAVDPAAALQITSPAAGKVKQPMRPDLARLGSKKEEEEESSTSSSAAPPSSKSGSGTSAAAAISSRTHVHPAPLSPPPRLPVVRSTSSDGGASTALTSAIASSGIASGRSDAAQINDDENDSDDTYDRIQRDVRPSKVKAAAARQLGGGGRGSGEFDVPVPDRGRTDSTAYEEVHPVAQRQQPAAQPVALSAASIAASGSDLVTALQMGRPPPSLPPARNEHDEEDGEGCYDVIQRDVNPAKAKQKRIQQQQPMGPYSIVDREGDGRSVKSAGNDDDGADTYDVIQRDVNPLKAKQQQQLLQRAKSADGREADEVDTRAKPRRAVTLDAYTNYSLPQTSALESSARAGDGRGGMADPTRTVAEPPRSQHQRSNNGSGEPVPAAAAGGAGGYDDGGEYECIRENFVVDIARPSAKGEQQPRWMEGSDSSDGMIGSSGSAQLGASSATTARAAAAAATDAPTAASAAKATSHGDDARTRAAASAAAPPPISAAAAPARAMYSEVRAVVQRPGTAAAAAAAAAAVPSAAAAGASAGRLPPLPPAKQFSTSTEDDAYCTVTPSYDAGASSQALFGGRLSSGLQQTTATTASETSGELRKLRANVTPHCYENVDVSPLSQHQQQLGGARNAPPTDSEANFESSSAFYANDQSLRGSPQPPALTASPPLPRSGGGVRSRDAEAHRPRPAAPAQGAAGSLPPPLIPPPSPSKPQLKAKPVGSAIGAEVDFAMSASADRPAQQQQQPVLKAKPAGGILYAEIDLAVGTPAGHPVQQHHQQQHSGQHTHSTQDGLFQYGSTSTVGSPAPSIPLSPPRQRPWVPRREHCYEDVDDVRKGGAA